MKCTLCEMEELVGESIRRVHLWFYCDHLMDDSCNETLIVHETLTTKLFSSKLFENGLSEGFIVQNFEEWIFFA